MLGAICGDVIGSRLELNNETIEKDFELITPKNNFTYNTVFLIAMMDCINNKSSEYEEYLVKWCLKYPNAGYGTNFKCWLNSADKKTYKSKDNGCLIRALPLTYVYSKLRFKDYYEELDKAICFTHNTKESHFWVKALALTMWGIKNKLKRKVLFDFVESNCDYKFSFTTIPDIKNYKSSLAQTIAPYCLLTGIIANDYEEGVRDIIYRNINNNTGAAIVGGILEMRGIYPDLRLIYKVLDILPKKMKKVIYEFYKKED